MGRPMNRLKRRMPCVTGIHYLSTSAVSWPSTTEGVLEFLLWLDHALTRSGHRYADSVTMFKAALEVAQVTQTSQASWATTWLNLGTSLRKLGKMNDARDAYIKVLEIDSRSAPALGFLGLVYHLMDHLDEAIIKYHEVRFPLPLY